MSLPRAFFVLGFRGVGKSSLGSAFSEKGGEFLDMDRKLEERLGMPLLEYYVKRGEPAFRDRELELLEELLPAVEARNRGPLLYVATGGGIVENQGARKLFKASPLPKLWLDSDPETLWNRLSREPERLRWGGLVSPESLMELWKKRRPLYEEIATKKLLNRDIHECLAAIEHWTKTLWP